ncbi:MAG TPA: PAS domain-containing protein [Ohtaekwangia sp.]|uniref:PAS domain-containing protein n=1 Tax=Ohtaekwangia sp. TaxID=2066019 RepID=UPI002F953EFF
MKIFPYSIVKKNDLASLQHKLSQHQVQITGATQFVKAIEQGNLDVQYNDTDEVTDENLLATSLVSMRNQMKKFSREEKQRNWVTEGLAQFVDILRSKNDNLAELSNQVISSLIKYMGANQGALYIIDEDDPKDVYLELVACYAYNRQKHLNQRFSLGEGIIGQVILEKTTTYLKDIPKDYVRITSGLGEGLPRNLLVVPLKIEETVLGVVEIASFAEIKKYQIEFVEKLGESIASTISAAKVAERTTKLLQESRMQAEHMRTQEEEMRQSMEELAATQEEMQRILVEVQAKEGYLNEVLNASSDSIFTVDKEFSIISFNRAFNAGVEAMGVTARKGMDILTIFQQGPERDKQRMYYKRGLAGEHFDITESFEIGGKQSYYVSSYSPLRDKDGHVFAVACFAKDITEMMRARHDAERMAHEAQQANEEMKAQEEELRQNMEELSATQEEMHRILNEVQEHERYLNEVLNASSDSIYTLDREYKVISYNKAFSAGLEAIGLPVVKGFEMLSIFQQDQKQLAKQRDNYDRAFKGEHFQITEAFDINGVQSHYVNFYSPMRDASGAITAIACFAKEVTELVNAQHEAKEKETYLNNMLNASGDAIMAVDRDLRVVLANKAMIKIFQEQDIQEPTGFHVADLVRKGKGDPDAFTLPYRKALNGESSEITRNSFGHHYIVTYNPLRTETGEVIGASAFTKDITIQATLQQQTEKLLAESQQQAEELKAQEEELRQNMEELSATQEAMERQVEETNKLKRDLEIRESVFTLTTILSEADLNGNITLVNEKLCEVSGYTEEELLGKPHSLLRHADMPKELFKLFWSTLKKGEVFKGIIKNKTKSGGHYWVDATVVPVKDEAGVVVKYIGARYHLEDEEIALLLYNRQAKKLNLPALRSSVLQDK